MKKTKKNKIHDRPIYPNAASRSYFIGKLLNAATAAASCMGFLTVLLFFFLL